MHLLRGSHFAVTVFLCVTLVSMLAVGTVNASTSTLALSNCSTDIAGRTFVLTPGETLTVTFSQPCVWGYGPDPYSGFAPTNPGSQSGSYPLYDSSSQLVADVERNALPGQVVLTFIARSATAATSNQIFFTFGSTYQAFNVKIQTQSNSEETTFNNIPASHLFSVLPLEGKCPSGWTRGGWEEWAQAPVCNLTTSFNATTGNWTNGTYQEVIDLLTP